MTLVLLLRDDGSIVFVPDVVPPPFAKPWVIGWSINRADANARVRAIEDFEINYLLGNRTVLHCATVDPRPDTINAYRPDTDQELSVSINPSGTPVPIFAGTVAAVNDNPIEDPNFGTTTKLDAVGNEAIAESREISRTFGSDQVQVAIVSPGNPAVVTTSLNHGFVTGQTVILQGVVPSANAADGTYVITVTAANRFSIPLNLTGLATGGTARVVMTLRDIMQALVTDFLAANGITLSMTDPGPVLEKQVFDGNVADAISQLMTITGWVARYLPNKVLEVFAPGSKVGGFTLDGHSRNIRWSKVSIRTANRIILTYGNESVVTKTEYFRGNGSNRLFPLTYKPAATGITSPGSVFDYQAQAYRHVGVWGVDTLFEWVYRATDNALVQLISSAGGANPPPPNGAVYSFIYDVQFPQKVISEGPGAAANPKEMRFTAPTIFDVVPAKQLADAYLRKMNRIPPRQFTCDSQQGLEYPGTALPVNIPERLLTGNWLITGLRISEQEDGALLYSYELLEGNEPIPSWVDWFKDLNNGGANSASGGGGGTTSGELLPPTTPPPIPLTQSGTYFLGGSGLEAVQSPTPTWVPASGGGAIGQAAIQAVVNTTLRGTRAATVRVRMRSFNSGVTVQARLWNVTDNVAVAGTSSVVNSTNWTTVSFPVALADGEKSYELHLLPGTANEDVFGTGQLE